MPSPLPIDAVLPELVAVLQHRSNVVLRAPTGAGKTTRVPPALLDADLAGAGRIFMLEPRRLAARAAARRIASERGGRPGGEVGYHVRFDCQAGPRTRIVAVTPGILLRLLHDEPLLEGTTVVVFDEFHERGLESDLALGMVRLIQQTVRPELRIVVMSATLDTGSIACYLGTCPVIESAGRLHPVEIRYEPRPPHQSLSQATAQAVERVLKRTDGDVLVFLPGLQEIRRTARDLEATASAQGLAVLPLHGDLPPEQQDAALQPLESRKVVLSTNVAETSVTVEGITAVVDTGLARVLRFHGGLGLDRLDVEPISRAAADQRAGRAGRTRPGVCVRLWDERSQATRLELTEPEIQRVDLAGAVLQLLALGEADVTTFPWFEAPGAAAVSQALLLLRRLGAHDDAGLTELGRSLSRLPVHPRLGRLLIEGRRLGQSRRAALAAALLSERDPFMRATSGARPSARAQRPTDSDVLDRVDALETFEERGQIEFPLGTLHAGAARFVLRARDQLASLLAQGVDALPTDPVPADEAVSRAILAAFPDRVARRRNPGGTKGVMVGGRGVKLAPWSGVKDAELFVCVDVEAGQSESTVRQASGIRREWLSPDKVTATTDIAVDPTTGRVSGWKRLRFDDLLLEEVQAALPDEETVARILAEAAGPHLERVLPAPDSPAGRWLIRVRCLRAWMPHLDLPAFDDSALRELLPAVCGRCRSFEDVRKSDWLGVLRGRLNHTQLQAVEREVPDRLEVPSGSSIALQYEEGRPPVLAVRIQELFGMADTPRLAGGRVKVLLHLLAPNFRPQQVTDDLASFWTNTYPVVRKELRARYPKHAWPEDPRSAPAQKGPRRK